MSDIETDEEYDGNKTLRRPKWRATFNNLIDRIDQSLGVRRMYSETPSSRLVYVEKLKPEIFADHDGDNEKDNEQPAVTDPSQFQVHEEIFGKQIGNVMVKVSVDSKNAVEFEEKVFNQTEKRNIRKNGQAFTKYMVTYKKNELKVLFKS